MDPGELRALTASHKARALDEAKAFLREQLASGPRPATELFESAAAEGVSKATLRRAGKILCIDIRKRSRDGGWVWSLPEPLLAGE